MKKVAVLLSGGVDSTASALILKDLGYKVIGVTLNITDEAPKRAKKIAEIIGIEHFVIDVKDEFRGLVIEPFIRWYTSGLTPNPCSLCNRRVKFGVAFEKIFEEFNVDLIATGHYVGKGVYKNHTLLKEGLNKLKEQSYFLALIKKEVIQKVVFPMENKTKSEVVEFVNKRLGLNFDSRGSQEICFLEGKDVHQFIRERVGSYQRGDIVYIEEDKKIGEHEGIYNYTIGMRRFGISFGKPLYVVKLDPKSNTVFVGGEDLLYKDEIYIKDLNLHLPLELWEEPYGRIRYRSEPVRIKDFKREKGYYRVKFEKPVRAPTPGQVLAIYEREYLIGGAIIYDPDLEYHPI